MTEPAPRGDPIDAGATLILHAGIDVTSSGELGGELAELAELVELPRDASEEAIGAALGDRPAPRTLVDLRFVGWEPAVPPAAAAQEAALAVFRLARVLFSSALRCERVIAVTELGGRAGLGDGDAPPTALASASGAAGGAWKSVVREWPESCPGAEPELTLLDLPGGWDQASVDVLKGAMAERGPRELGVRAGQRSTLVLRPFELPAAAMLDAESVLLLTGGARGVTARIARELASRYRCRLVLADLSAPAAPGAPRLDAASARRLAREQLGEAAPVPEVNAVSQRLLAEQAAADTVAELEALGSEVLYCPGDVTDPEEAARLIAQARDRFGRIDVVIHGAGIDRSRNVLSKAEAEVALVVGVKAAAAELFAGAGAGARAVGFCSVAGRFGNAGQTDYCAANEALAKLIATHGGLALDFTAWADIGMAAPIAKAMRERGVDPLDPDDAARLAVDLIAAGATGEYVLAGRLRPHDGSVAERDALAGVVTLEVPGSELRRSTRLELEAAAYLRDHRPTSAGVLPAVVALQGMIDAAATLEPTLAVRAVRDLEIEQAVKVFPDRPISVAVHAERRATEADAVWIGAAVVSDAGTHHRAVVELGATAAPPLAVAVEASGPGPDGREVYRTFFHGPSFQVLADSTIGAEGLVARSRPLAGELGEDLPVRSRWLAMARELVLQAAGVFLMTAERRLALPVGVAELTPQAVPREGERVTARVRYRRADSDGELYRFDAELRGEDDRLLEHYRGLSFRYLGRL